MILKKKEKKKKDKSKERLDKCKNLTNEQINTLKDNINEIKSSNNLTFDDLIKLGFDVNKLKGLITCIY